MTSYLWILVLAALAVSRAQNDLNLFDALDDEPTKPPVKPPKAGGDVNPPKAGGDATFDLDIFDALGTDTPPKPKKPAGDPSKTGGTGDFNIFDAVDKVDPKKPSGGGGGGGGGIDDSDLFDVAGNGDYKPEPGQGGRGGARAGDSSHDTSGGGEQGATAQSGQMAGIISAVGVAILGAASSYFAYQKKKLCFKIQGGTDPESGTNQAGTHSDPQVLSNLLKSSS